MAVPVPASLTLLNDARAHVQLPMQAVACQPSLVELGKTRSAPLPSVEDPEDYAKLQPLVRTRTISAVSTDSCVSALSSSTTYWSPSSHVTPKSVAYPPGMGLTPLAAGSPVQRILAPSPIVRTISTGSEVSLGRTLSTSRPYPPGLGYTPISTPKDSLSRASSFGINGEVESCKPRRKSMDLTAVLEAHAEDHIFSREFMLLFRGSPEGEDAAEVGFVLPAPGFFRTQAAGPEAAPQTQSEAPRPAKVATTKAKPAQAQAAQGKGKGWSEPGKGAAETSQAPVAAQKGSPAAQKGSPPSHGYKGQQAQQHQYYPMKGQSWAGKGAWTWGAKGGWYMWPGQKGGWY